MRIDIALVASAAALTVGTAAAQPLSENPPTSTIICLDVAGRRLPVTCQVPSSRLDKREDICLCPRGGERVVAPICPAGVRPPGESAAYEAARQRAVQHGSLVGATWQGQPMCVAPRQPEYGR